MAVIHVNGQRIEIEGDATGVSVRGDAVFVGGKRVAGGLTGVVTVRWEGPLASLEADCSVEVAGDVHGSVKAGNSAHVDGSVQGDVKAGNSVTCGDVKGDVKAGNSVSRR